MPISSDWELPPSAQPKPGDYRFDLDDALAAVVSIKAEAPDDAFTAGTLGTERRGSGVLIRPDGLILTMGYLIVETEAIWLQLTDGRTLPGHALAYHHNTGFGLVQVLERGPFPCLPLGNSARARLGDRVVVAGGGGRSHAVAAHVVAKQEFAGYWEYLLDEAIFTAPSHPRWGGTAVINADGQLVGVGSLQVEQAGEGRPVFFNMAVPTDLLPPILDDLLARGRAPGPPRPWLGFYSTEVDGKIVVAGVVPRGPAHEAGIDTNDLVLAVAGEQVSGLAGMYRKIWSLGSAGVEVPLLIYREGRTLEVTVTSGDRNSYLKVPQLH